MDNESYLKGVADALTVLTRDKGISIIDHDGEYITIHTTHSEKLIKEQCTVDTAKAAAEYVLDLFRDQIWDIEFSARMEAMRKEE